MAFGATSKVSSQWASDQPGQVTLMDWDANTVKSAQYGNAGTPDNTVAAATFAYNTGQWVTGNEITSSTDIPAGGLTLASKTNVKTGANVVFSAANTASGAAATASVYGCLIYSDTIATPVAKQGWCYNSYGGSVVNVSAGTLTLVWDPTNGIFKFAC
jgi:hypothetical protein